MSRQFNFYIEEELERDFLKFVFECGISVLISDHKNEIIRYDIYEKYLESGARDFKIFFYKNVWGDLEPGDQLLSRSPVIEHCLCLLYDNKMHPFLTSGRIYLNSYISPGLEKESDLYKSYFKLKRWLNKRLTYKDYKYGDRLIWHPLSQGVVEYLEKGYDLGI